MLDNQNKVFTFAHPKSNESIYFFQIGNPLFGELFFEQINNKYLLIWNHGTFQPLRNCNPFQLNRAMALALTLKTIALDIMTLMWDKIILRL